MTRTVNQRENMRSHVLAHYPILYFVTFEEKTADSLIRYLAEGRKILEWNMARGHVHFHTKLPIESVRMTTKSDDTDLSNALDNWLDQDLDGRFLVVRDAHLALHDNPLAIARLKALADQIIRDDVAATVFLVSSQLLVAPELERFITVFYEELPDETEIRQIIRCFCKEQQMPDVDEEVASELEIAFRGLSRYEIRCLLKRGLQLDGKIDIGDKKLVIDEKKQIVKKSGILEMVSVTEGMDDIGGLGVLKAWLEQKAKIMADLPRARDFGVETPKGAMIVGMPGCGKSLTAKATATRLGLPLLRLDIGSLMGRYVGDSEANMRRALTLAETVSPCVLWVDEVEKAFTGVGGGSASSGSEITNRLFGYFLTWMQEKTKPVFVLTTANDVSVLPPELLRKGRFDEIFYVDFPKEDERAAILQVHLRKRKKDGSGIDVNHLARETGGFSGADLEGMVKDAIEEVFLEGEAELNAGHLRASMEKNRSHALMMERKAKEYRTRLKEMGIRNAADGHSLS